MPPETARRLLLGLRRVIDGVDDALLLLLAGRRQCVQAAATLKRAGGLPAHDPQREGQVRRRAQALGRRLRLPPAVSERFARGLIEEAHVQQGLPVDAARPSAAIDLDQRGATDLATTLATAMDAPAFPPRLLRWLPPPRRLAPWLRRVPAAWQARLLQTAMARVLAAPVQQGALEALCERRLGIEVSDLGLRWVVELREGQLRVLAPEAQAEATVRGSATDLLLLASRREDADTLFFQRRLLLTGETELGLTARNLLDQLPWDSVPLGLRILLHRGAGLAESARAAHGCASAASAGSAGAAQAYRRE